MFKTSQKELLKAFYNNLGKMNKMVLGYSFIDKTGFESECYTTSNGNESGGEINQEVTEEDVQISAVEPANDADVAHDENDVQDFPEANQHHEVPKKQKSKNMDDVSVEKKRRSAKSNLTRPRNC